MYVTGTPKMSQIGSVIYGISHIEDHTWGVFHKDLSALRVLLKS